MQAKLRNDAYKILKAGIGALSPHRILTKGTFNKLDIFSKKHIYLIGFGKGIRFYARRVEEILGRQLKKGMVNDIEKMKLGKVVVNKASHPLPDETSVASTLEIVRFLKKIPKEGFILCLIAGGGSALFSWPTLSINKFKKLNELLIKSGADIFEINTVRKHTDRVKGGGLAKIIYPRSCISFIISDVPSDDLKTIASGPTVYDPSTKEEAQKIIKKYHIDKIFKLFPRLIETPKDKKIFRRIKNVLLATNKIALKEMAKMATRLGYKAIIFDSALSESTEKAGQMAIKKFNELKSEKDKIALIGGGETTVRVKGKSGRGGRNTHLCLLVLNHLPEDMLFACIDSDGQDNSDAAGAIIDQETIKKAQRLKLEPKDYLKKFDSYNFFKKTGDLIKTGPLPTNVGDLFLVLRNKV